MNPLTQLTNTSASSTFDKNNLNPYTKVFNDQQENSGGILERLKGLGKQGLQSIIDLSKSEGGKLAGDALGMAIPAASKGLQVGELLLQAYNMYGNRKLGNVQSEIIRNMLQNLNEKDEAKNIAQQIQPQVGGKGIIDNENALQMQIADMIHNKNGNKNQQALLLLQLLGGIMTPQATAKQATPTQNIGQ